LNEAAHKLPVQFGSSDWQPFANHSTDRANTSNESKIVLAHILVNQRGEMGAQIMSSEAVLENVRRFRTIASLYRQTAAFRPGQSWSLLGQAKDWAYRALAELESYFKGSAQRTSARLEIAIAA
jgi:hypothetical protein